MLLLRSSAGLRACHLHTLAPLSSVQCATSRPALHMMPIEVDTRLPVLPKPVLTSRLSPGLVEYRISNDDFVEPAKLSFSPSQVKTGDEKESGNDPSQSQGSGSNRGSKASPEILEDVTAALCTTLNGFFTRKLDLRFYREDIVFENRVRGTEIHNLVNYGRFLHLLRIWANLRFVFISTDLKTVTISKENSTVTIHFQLRGIGITKMFLYYIPKKMWRHKNLVENSTVIEEGISTYHVDGGGYIFRHVFDNKDVDKDKPVTKLEEVKEKLQKLKGSTVPNPNL